MSDSKTAMSIKKAFKPKTGKKIYQMIGLGESSFKTSKKGTRKSFSNISL